jgi:hypothetical protein
MLCGEVGRGCLRRDEVPLRLLARGVLDACAPESHVFSFVGVGKDNQLPALAAEPPVAVFGDVVDHGLDIGGVDVK